MISLPPTVTNAPVGHYAALKSIIKEQGLLDKTVTRSMFRFAVIQLLFVASLALLFMVHAFWFQCLNALFLAVITVQLGFIGHDAGHRQLFHSIRNNNAIGFLVGNVQIGMSFSWWMSKHNAHHAHPNEVDNDPDINVPLIAFSQAEALEKRGFARFVVKHQAWLYFPILLFVTLDMHLSSIKYLLRKDATYRWRELAFMGLYFVWYVGLIFTALPFWQAIIFVAIHQGATGVHLGSVFAPNHKGMLILERETRLDFLRQQVLTARNVRPNLIIDQLYGGLNYQIEHHLFPNMPRRHLARAHRITRDFCAEHGIAYYETSWFQSYREILASLALVGAPLRAMSKRA